MRISPRNQRIGGAALIAIVMVGGAYLLPGFRFPKTKTVDAALTDDLLASYVAKDTDGDGLPDWQEALYGTDPNKAMSNSFGVSDGEAVKRGLLTPNALASQVPKDPVGSTTIPGPSPAAGSITDQFSQAFFQAYMTASGGQPLSADAQQALLQKVLADFNQRAAQKLSSSYTNISIHTDPNVSVRAYAKSVEDVLGAHVLTGEDANAVLLMGELVINNDSSAGPKLSRLASAYGAIASSLLAVRVPPQLAAQHLELLRAFDTLGKSTALVATYKTDPLGVLGAFAVYTPAAGQLNDAFNGIATEILRTGEPADGQPGSLLIYIARAKP